MEEPVTAGISNVSGESVNDYNLLARLDTYNLL